MSLTLRFVFYLCAIATICNAAPSGLNGKMPSMTDNNSRFEEPPSSLSKMLSTIDTDPKYRSDDFEFAASRALNPHVSKRPEQSASQVAAENREREFEALANKLKPKKPEIEDNNDRFVSRTSESSARDTKEDTNADRATQKPKNKAEWLEDFEKKQNASKKREDVIVELFQNIQKFQK